MKVKPKQDTIFFAEDWKITISLKPQQKWECTFYKDYICIERDNVTLKLTKEEFEKYFTKITNKTKDGEYV